MINLKKLSFSILKILRKIFIGTVIGRNYHVVKLYYKLFSILKPNYIFLDGHKLFIDKNDFLGLTVNTHFESFEKEIFIKSIKKSDCVLDIGANIGYYTLLAAKAVGSEGKVYSFEPDPEYFKVLEKNVIENNYSNVILLNKAVSNKNGKVKLYMGNRVESSRLRTQIGSYNTIYSDDSDKRYIEVDAISLDSFFKNVKHKIDIIKIDIEGAEPFAIEGMKEILKQNKKIIMFIEYFSEGIKSSGNSPKKLIDDLSALGFDIKDIDEKNKSLIDLDCDKFSYDKTTNLLCVKDK